MGKLFNFGSKERPEERASRLEREEIDSYWTPERQLAQDQREGRERDADERRRFKLHNEPDYLSDGSVNMHKIGFPNPGERGYRED